MVLSGQQGLAVEKDETSRGVSSTALFDSSIPTRYGSIPAPKVSAVDFRWVIPLCFYCWSQYNIVML